MSPWGGADRLAALWFRQVALTLHSPRWGRVIVRVLCVLERSEAGDRRALEALRDRKLAALLEHATATVPFYAPAALAALDAERAASDHPLLADRPLVCKAHVRAAGRELTSRDPAQQPATRVSTGGSTGEPLQVWKDVAAVAWAEAAVLRARGWAGVRLGDPGVSLSSTGRVSVPGALRARLVNLTPLVAAVDDATALQAVLTEIDRRAPRFLAGYPSALLALEGVARVTGKGTVPVLFTTGEMLDPEQRARLEQTFGARVFDAYGSNEIGGLAFECEHGQKHVTEEHVVLEVLDDAGTPVWDAPGRIVVTDLDNRTMPFVRYVLGDVGVLTRTPCPCGRPHRVLQRLEGRVQDVLRSPDGRALPSIFFAGVFRELREISACQIEQVSLEQIELRYAPAGAGARREAEGVAAILRERLGPAVAIVLSEREAIALSARGKARPVIGLRSGAR